MFFSKLEKDFVPVKAFFKRIFIFSVSNSMDSTGYGFKTIVPEGTVGDRVPGVVEWNLFDMEAKFCDVVPVDIYNE